MQNKFRINIPKQVLFLIVLVFALVLGYTVLADSTFFLYLIWNIFLAFLPFLVSALLLWYVNNKNIKISLLVVSLIFWLILFPNAPYIVTDLIHLNVNPQVPLWFDILLIFSSAYIGLYLGIHSLDHIEQIFLKYFNKNKTNILIIISIFLSSFGIYLGRFPRWNSWDLFIQPKSILLDAWNVLNDPFNNKDAYITTIAFFVFILVSYYIWKYSRKKQ